MIKPGLVPKKAYKIILDRILKLVHFSKMSTMDESGWFKLLQFYGKGYRAAQNESLLFEKVLLFATPLVKMRKSRMLKIERPPWLQRLRGNSLNLQENIMSMILKEMPVII